MHHQPHLQSVFPDLIVECGAVDFRDACCLGNVPVTPPPRIRSMCCLSISSRDWGSSCGDPRKRKAKSSFPTEAPFAMSRFRAMSPTTLIDKAPTPGGTLRQLDHQFPGDHRGMCRMLPLVQPPPVVVLGASALPRPPRFSFVEVMSCDIFRFVRRACIDLAEFPQFLRSWRSSALRTRSGP